MTDEELRTQILKNLSELDFVRVTRCRDCEYYHETSVGWCNLYDEMRLGSGFCSEAKRKNGRRETGNDS